MQSVIQLTVNGISYAGVLTVPVMLAALLNALCLNARTLGHMIAAAAKDSGDLNGDDSRNVDNAMKTQTNTVPWWCLLLFLLSWLAVPVDAATDRELMVALTASWNCTDPSWRDPAVPVCSWIGVMCGNGTIQKFSWGQKGCTGTVNLANLPPSMVELWFKDNAFNGPVDLTHLPPSMVELHLDNNAFNGPVDLAHLPPSMVELGLGNNAFNGPSTLHTSLPP